jgi:hypothetical protein
MSKQIKLGLDKGAIRSYETDQVLVDGRGIELVDGSGKPLYTKTNAVVDGAFAPNRATPMIINNRSTTIVRPNGALPIREQFPEASEVSSTLLGIPRLGKQQSLFADVSIYGLNDSDWEFFRTPEPFQPPEWSERINSTYGRRGGMSLREIPEEQALAIQAFPVPYTFPFDRVWETSGRFNELFYLRYVNFILMGNLLYDFYTQDQNNTKRISFAKEKFLDPSIVTTETNSVIYNTDVNIDKIFSEVEKWTKTWIDIRSNLLTDPDDEILSFSLISSNAFLATDFNASNTRPGISDTAYYYGQLQSKEAYRYQPGAASGFTFGIKTSLDNRNSDTTIEWGCANDTDQYMFQIRGERFSIIRRSTVPLSTQALEQMGLRPEDQVVSIPPNPFERPAGTSGTGSLREDPNDPGDTRPRYETRIQQDFFNGDRVDGTGRSRYRLSFEEVTMYKIEFSWYGAIGAKFYAYVPSGNAEARWVLMHTMLIENMLESPSLKNPYFKFRYCIYLNNTANVVKPMFVYKYGASYYIDGADEGTYAYNSYASEKKNIINDNSVPLLGFYPKNTIQNSTGIQIKNQKNFLLEKISVNSTKNARIDMLECQGCQDGFGHFYLPRIVNGSRGELEEFRISIDGTKLQRPEEANTTFSTSDNGKKIVGPGIFCSYIEVTQDDVTEAQIVRRTGGTGNSLNTLINRQANYSNDNQIRIAPGVIRGSKGYEFIGKITGYDDTIASSYPITKKNFTINFLNPIANEGSTLGNQWAEFLVGLTNKKPIVDDEVLKFQLETETPQLLDRDVDGIYAEFTPFEPNIDTRGVEIGDRDPRVGNIMYSDYRIPDPLGINSGRCSRLTGTVTEQDYDFIEYTTVHPDPSITDPGHFLIFSETVANTLSTISLIGGQFGIQEGLLLVSSNETFIDNLKEYEQIIGEIITKTFYVEISGKPDSFVVGSPGKIFLRSLRIFGRYVSKSKVFSFDVFPLYLFVQMRDNAVINGISVTEFDETRSFSFVPSWITDGSNVTIQQYSNTPAGSNIPDTILGSSEYLDLQGRFRMGGFTDQNSPPASFNEKNRLDSVLVDTSLFLPLRPGRLKTTFFARGNKSEQFDLKYLFGDDRYKITTGEFNTTYYYLSAKTITANETGEIRISVSAKEQ